MPCVLCHVKDIANVLWGLGSLGPAALLPLISQQDLTATIQQLLGRLQRLQLEINTATPQVCCPTGLD